MFSIIDSRYRCNKPLIVTTNLKLDELKRPPDLAHAQVRPVLTERPAQAGQDGGKVGHEYRYIPVKQSVSNAPGYEGFAPPVRDVR